MEKKIRNQRNTAIFIGSVLLGILAFNAYSEKNVVMIFFWLIMIIPTIIGLKIAFNTFSHSTYHLLGIIVMLTLGISVMARIAHYLINL